MVHVIFVFVHAPIHLWKTQSLQWHFTPGRLQVVLMLSLFHVLNSFPRSKKPALWLSWGPWPVWPNPRVWLDQRPTSLWSASTTLSPREACSCHPSSNTFPLPLGRDGRGGQKGGGKSWFYLLTSNLVNYANTDSSLDFHIVPCFDFSTLLFKISWQVNLFCWCEKAL